ncbi:MAG TPA: transglutaminaseTgpA domain-containing protein, partial [Polyangia bacterium]|nr:transglutaminaseTgpA domain-containing protein [Polyangia bacterium]
MRFSAIHKATSYLMVAAAFATLALSHELSPVVVGLTLGAGLLSYPFEPARHPLLRARAWTAGWNAVSLAFFALTLIDAIRGDALPAGVRFLCFLLVNKLWNRKSSRDYLQAYVVSFLMLVAGAALNNELAYAGCFLAYVIFATWTLTPFHLRREMEENYLI